MKTCNTCNIKRPLTEFHKRENRKAGFVGKCKKCSALYNKRIREKQSYKDWYSAHQKTDAFKQSQKKYRQSPAGVEMLRKFQSSDSAKEKQKEWAQSATGKKSINAASQRARRNHPEKAKARSIVSGAIRAGKLVKKPCEICDDTNVEAHHPSYDKPLDVMWLCQKHHSDWHKNHGEII